MMPSAPFSHFPPFRLFPGPEVSIMLKINGSGVLKTLDTSQGMMTRIWASLKLDFSFSIFYFIQNFFMGKLCFFCGFPHSPRLTKSFNTHSWNSLNFLVFSCSLVNTAVWGACFASLLITLHIMWYRHRYIFTKLGAELVRNDCRT